MNLVEVQRFLETATPVLTVMVLVVSLVILWRGIVEEQQRRRLIERLEASRAALSRANYLLTVAHAVTQATESVYFVSSTIEEEGDELPLQRLIEARQRAMGRVKDYRAIVPRDALRIKGAYELLTSGVEVLVSGRLAFGDLNFTIIDGRIAVLGVPAHKSGPSTVGLAAHSTMLITLLQSWYEILLKDEQTEPLREFATRIIAMATKQGTPPELIEARTGVPAQVQREWLQR